MIRLNWIHVKQSHFTNGQIKPISIGWVIHKGMGFEPSGNTLVIHDFLKCAQNLLKDKLLYNPICRLQKTRCPKRVLRIIVTSNLTTPKAYKVQLVI